MKAVSLRTHFNPFQGELLHIGVVPLFLCARTHALPSHGGFDNQGATLAPWSSSPPCERSTQGGPPHAAALRLSSPQQR